MVISEIASEVSRADWTASVHAFEYSALSVAAGNSEKLEPEAEKGDRQITGVIEIFLWQAGVQ